MHEEQRLELILEAIKYCRKVKQLGMPASSYTKALREPIHFLWERRNGSKIKAAKYRSVNAIHLTFGNSLLVYDHAIPFKYLQEKLLQSKQLTISSLKEILEKYIIVCLITKEEEAVLKSIGLNSKMPNDWDGENHLARYKAAGIETIEIF